MISTILGSYIFHQIQCMSGLVTTGLGALSRLCCCSGEAKVTVSPAPARLIPDTLRYSANNFPSPSVNKQFHRDSDKRCSLSHPSAPGSEPRSAW